MDMSEVGIVVIGRNEGERLGLCLKSVLDGVCPIIYVDSGSVDGSIVTAGSFGLEVVSLDPGRPFSAARARNEGFQRLVQLHPGVRFVQFVDGDCELLPGWLDAARRALLANAGCVAVVGHLQERNAHATPYNRLCALEWKSPPGVLKDFGGFGGVSMIRADVFQKLGGFNPAVIAGEDSELGVRIGLAGYRVTKIDQPMATHDANITSFQQWWRRAVRAGHAIGQRAHLNGDSELKDCVKERNSTWLWGIGLPLLVLFTLAPSQGMSLVLLGGYANLFLRVLRYRRRHGDNREDAVLYAKFLLLAKIANGVGLIRFYVNRLARRYEIIEYK